MIEKILLDHMAQKLDVPVFMEVPEAAPPSFVVLEKTGGSRKDSICTAMIAVQSHARTLLAAAQLNEQAKRAMDSLSGLAKIAAVRLNSDYNFTDTASKRYRYQAVYDVTHY